MPDIHILTQDKDQKTVNAVFHIPVPITLNAAGITWQAAVVKEAGEITSVLSDIDPTELTSLQAGALIEKVENVRFSTTELTNTERLQEVKDQYNIVRSELIAEKQTTLAFIGFETEVI